jgi:selenocysteine-specific elongation factor
MSAVAAGDPSKPQASAHPAALDALGVRHGVLVVTRADLADPRPALERARDQLARTTLSGLPACVVSGRTGAGTERLRRLLDEVLASLPGPDPAADVRLWIDRAFTMSGTGTVVTGTLRSGTITAGDTLAVGEETVRVRGVQCLGRPVPAASGVARVALDLGGHAPAGVGRGAVLVTPGAFAPTTLVDVRVPDAGALTGRPLLHLGTTTVSVRVRPLGQDTVRLVLDAPLPLRLDDHGLLRDPGSRTLWGVRVLDPAPPPLARRGAAAARAVALAGSDRTLATQLRQRGASRRSELRRIGVDLTSLPPGTVAAGDWLLGPEDAARARQRLPEVLTALAAPLQRGVPLAAVARALGLPDPALVGPLLPPALEQRDGRVRRRGEELSAPLRAAAEALGAHLVPGSFQAPDAGRLRELGVDAATLAALHRAGLVLRRSDQVVLAAGADRAALEVLRELPQPFTASEARAALGSSRRVVLPLLAHLDRTGATLRLPDDRRRVRTPGAA